MRRIGRGGLDEDEDGVRAALTRCNKVLLDGGSGLLVIIMGGQNVPGCLIGFGGG